jgi:glycosyltransferase involved in cell wall biosynthesis
MARQEKLDLLIVTGLRLVLPTVLASRQAKIPVMFDMVEYFPGISQSQRQSQFKRNIKNIISTVFEFIAVKTVDFVCVVVEEQGQRLLELGLPASNISVVSNTPFLSDKNTSQWNGRIALHPDKEFRLTYAGLVQAGRGLDLIIKALPHIKASENGPPLVKFVIVGDGEEVPYLRKLAHKLEVEDKVEFVGWIPNQDIPAILKKSHVGVIPHVVSDFWNHTIPNKLFDYMLQGIPVLSTQAHPVERIVNQEQCGIVVPEDPLEVAKTILRLKENRALLEAMAKRGRQAVLKKYNWEQDSTIFLRALDDVMKRKRKQ